MITIKEAKMRTCGHPMCYIFHRTCRQCEKHLSAFGFYIDTHLCRRCAKEYDAWFMEEYIKPFFKEWDAMSEGEREFRRTHGGITPTDILWARNSKVKEWMLKFPIVVMESV